MKYTEHLAVGQYEFIEIEAETLKELEKMREAYFKSDFIQAKQKPQTKKDTW